MLPGPEWQAQLQQRPVGLPQQKLVFKQRNGAKVTKRHDTATTPHQRAIAHDQMRKRPIITMNATFKRLKPAALSRQIP